MFFFIIHGRSRSLIKVTSLFGTKMEKTFKEVLSEVFDIRQFRKLLLHLVFLCSMRKQILENLGVHLFGCP